MYRLLIPQLLSEMILEKKNRVVVLGYRYVFGTPQSSFQYEPNFRQDIFTLTNNECK